MWTTAGVTLLLALVNGCGFGPSKGQALEAIQREIKEDANCMLPLDVFSRVKVQHTTKAVCVLKAAPAKARACFDALVAAGVTRAMPESYLLAWPDEVAGASLSDLPAYDRRARNVTYSACFELASDLRAGRFSCADVRAAKVVSVSEQGEAKADVRYEREVLMHASLAAIDGACGEVTRPLATAHAEFVKNASGWVLSAKADAVGGGAHW